MSTPTIAIVYFTYNRLAYTKITLPAMIENAGVDFSLTIIDNGSKDGTVDYLQGMEKEYAGVISRVFYNSENRGLPLPTNMFWKTSTADYIGKVDNDTLVPPGWLATLLAAHEKTDKFGVIGGFHLNMGYVNEKNLKKRIIKVDGVWLLPDAFIGGCCYLMRRSVQQSLGYMQVDPHKKTFGWTEFQQDICRKGYCNGYIYPLLLVDHFDDPLSKYNLVAAQPETSRLSFAEKYMTLDYESMFAGYMRDARRVESGRSLADLDMTDDGAR